MRKDPTTPMSEHLATVGKKTSFLTGRTGWRRGSRPKSLCEACCLSFIYRCECFFHKATIHLHVLGSSTFAASL